MSRDPAVRREVPAKPVRLRQVIYSEWIKITTLRSTWYVLVFTILGMVGIGAIASAVSAAHWDSMRATSRATFSPVDTSLTGVALAQMIIAVLGVLLTTGEYTTGMVRSSLSAVPRRLPVLWAKLAVSAALSLIVSVVGGLMAFLVGQALLGSHSTTLNESHAMPAILGAAFYLMTITVVASAVGFILRSTAGGIATVLGVLLVVPVIGNVLPASWQHHLMPYLPSNAGNAVYAVHPYNDALSTGGGLIALCIWIVATSTIAAVLLRRRDA
ncbi:hypothetical protein BCD48_15630 [Pseudofrankia sp. BMG5.36]|nr:hypothetical protein BCD48_15630 [Pseudofrankia sp. BMG5.36]